MILKLDMRLEILDRNHVHVSVVVADVDLAVDLEAIAKIDDALIGNGLKKFNNIVLHITRFLFFLFIKFSFNRGGFQRDFYNNRRRRSPSDRRSPLRRRFRNQRNRRSRSQSNDRFRNRRHNRSSSRDRSNSRGAGGRTWKKGPMSPLSPSQMQQSSQSQSQMPNNGNFNLIPPVYSDGNVYNSNYPPNNMGGYMPNQSYSNYEYQVPMLQPPPGPFTAYPPPNVMQPIPPGDDFQSVPWQQPPPPPIINLPAEPMVMPQHIAPVITEAEEEKQKREGLIALNFIYVMFLFS